MAATIIDNGDSGYLETGAWTPYGVGHGGSLVYNSAGSGTNKVRWTLSGLTAGQLVRLAWTWVADPNRGTNVPWRVYDSDGTTVLASGTQNQQLNPVGFTDAGTLWQDLVSRIISGTSIAIETDDNANGVVIADAAWFDVTTPAANETYSLDSGDWSDAGNWSNGVPGGSVDTAIVNELHTVTVDDDAEVENLIMYGPVTVADGKTFTVTGSATQVDAAFTLGAGSALELDATAADVVWTRGTADAQTNCKIVANGTANVGDEADAPPSTTGGTHARIFKTGANDAYFIIGDTAGTFYKTGGYELTYCEVEGIADSTGFWGLPLYSSVDLLALHCTFAGCGRIFGSPLADSGFGVPNAAWFESGNNDFRVEYCKVTTTVSDVYPLYCSGAGETGSGTQTYIGNGVRGATRLNLKDGVVTGNYFDECPQLGLTPFATFSPGQFVRYGTNADTLTAGTEDCYLLADNRSPGGVGNQHFTAVTSTADSIGNVFEFPHETTFDLPDGFFGNLGEVEVAYNLIIPSMTDGLASSCLMNPGGGYIDPWKINLHHNSVFGKRAQLLFMENFRDDPTIFDKLRSNLVASPDLDDAYLLSDLDAYGTDHNVDSISPARNNNNWVHNGHSEADPDSSIVRVGYDNVRMSTNPTGPNIETSGTGYDGDGPRPVDAERCAARYAVYRGWASAEPALPHDNPTWDAWKYEALDALRDNLIDDPREGPLCRTWVRAGFAPQNPAAENSDYEGTAAIGAMDYQAAEVASGVVVSCFESPVFG